MSATMACVVAAALGIDAGWQPASGGGLEYIIQITPQRLESLAAGKTIWSDIPPGLDAIRSLRIEVGTRQLPQESGPPPAAAPDGLTETMAKEGRELPVRLTPQQVEELRLGMPVSCEMPSEVKKIRTYRVEVAAGQSDGQSVPPEAADPTAKATDRQIEPASNLTDTTTDTEVEPAANLTDPATGTKGQSLDDPAKPAETMLKQPAGGPLSWPAKSSADPAAPSGLLPGGDGKPLTQHEVAHLQQATTPTKPPGAQGPPDEKPSKPWWPLTLALGALCGSLSGNLYLGWITWSTRARYRALLVQSLLSDDRSGEEAVV